jgi:ribosomal protein S12 methylthiotransferase accessory factor YcaO
MLAMVRRRECMSETGWGCGIRKTDARFSALKERIEKSAWSWSLPDGDLVPAAEVGNRAQHLCALQWRRFLLSLL